MVHKQPVRARGRPRAYDPEQALTRATQAFWELGYSATSLDQLSDATDMNRPSLYAAFGDKRTLYLQTLERYTHASNVSIAAALDPQLPLTEGLRRFYDTAIASYFRAGQPARGCYLIGTALTEAVGDPEVRSKLADALRQFERALQVRLQQAQRQKELDACADTAGLAAVASAVLHSLAIRSRAGESRAALRTLVDCAIQLICGAQKPQAGKSRARRRN